MTGMYRNTTFSALRFLNYKWSQKARGNTIKAQVLFTQQQERDLTSYGFRKILLYIILFCYKKFKIYPCYYLLILTLLQVVVLSVAFSLMVKDPTKEDDGSLAQTSGKGKQKKKKRESFGTFNLRYSLSEQIFVQSF